MILYSISKSVIYLIKAIQVTKAESSQAEKSYFATSGAVPEA